MIAIVAVAVALAAEESVVLCDSGNTTACPSDVATCCPHSFSSTKWGCCPYPNAVCCEGSYGLCCPSGHTCKSTGKYSGLCIAPNASLDDPPPGLETKGAPQVCTPGPMEAPSSSGKSVIVIGDSVSIGYTPLLKEKLPGVQVQHAPSAGGGGADDTPYGEQCIVNPLESFIRTARYEAVKYDLITFNFGLHDMDYNTTDKSHSIANYTAQLETIADRLVRTGSKLLYVLTTPFMPADNTGNDIVHRLNAQALEVAKARKIPTVDLYSRVTEKCGTLYKTCSICAKDPCAYHYTHEGYDWIADTLAAAINTTLQ